MMRVAVGLIAVGVAIGLLACEREQPPGSGATTSTQPAGTPASVAPAGGGPAEVPTTQEALEKLKQVGIALKQKSEEEARQGLAQLDARVEELKRKLQTAEEKARPAIQKEIEQLSARAVKVRDMLGKLAGAGGDAWDELRKGVDAALGEFKEAVAPQPATQPAGPAIPAKP